MYRVYLRSPTQQVSDKTTTLDPVAARVAFESLVNRQYLDGQKVLAVITKNGSPVAHHKFNAPPHEALYFWRGRVQELQL